MADQGCQVEVPDIDPNSTLRREDFEALNDHLEDEENSYPLPTDTGTNYQPFFEVQSVSQKTTADGYPLLQSNNVTSWQKDRFQDENLDVGAPIMLTDTQEEDDDTPETSFSKQVIARLASHPDQSFILTSGEPISESHNTRSVLVNHAPPELDNNIVANIPKALDVSSIRPDQEEPSVLSSTLNTTQKSLAASGLSFASMEYLKRHGLWQPEDGSTLGDIRSFLR
jgi:hypothetical protein